MGWAVGDDPDRDRHIGYGVPATCDQPECGADIHRGMAYACGGGVMGAFDNCGLFFCSRHLSCFAENDGDGGEWVCARCADDLPPFEPSPDTAEWVQHLLTDESWDQWRDENPERVTAMRDEADL